MICSSECGLEEGLSRRLVVCFEGQREELKGFGALLIEIVKMI